MGKCGGTVKRIIKEGETDAKKTSASCTDKIVYTADFSQYREIVRITTHCKHAASFSMPILGRAKANVTKSCLFY